MYCSCMRSGERDIAPRKTHLRTPVASKRKRLEYNYKPEGLSVTKNSQVNPTHLRLVAKKIILVIWQVV